MAKYKVCEFCGSHIDFGEACDCGGIEYLRRKEEQDRIHEELRKKRKRKNKKGATLSW